MVVVSNASASPVEPLVLSPCHVFVARNAPLIN